MSFWGKNSPFTLSVVGLSQIFTNLSLNLFYLLSFHIEINISGKKKKSWFAAKHWPWHLVVHLTLKSQVKCPLLRKAFIWLAWPRSTCPQTLHFLSGLPSGSETGISELSGHSLSPVWAHCLVNGSILQPRRAGAWQTGMNSWAHLIRPSLLFSKRRKSLTEAACPAHSHRAPALTCLTHRCRSGSASCIAALQ